MEKMKKPKNKPNEPSLRDKLSAAYLAALEADFEANGVNAIQELRTKSPEKYCEIAARLIAATEPRSDDGYDNCQTQQDIGRKLLESIGFNDPDDASIEDAVKANDAFIERLKAIYFARMQ